MKYKFISFIAGVVAFVASAHAADFIEIKGADDLDNRRISFKLGSAYHSELQALPRAEIMVDPSVKVVEKEDSGYYVGYCLKSTITKKGIEGGFVGNLLLGFVDFSAESGVQRLSPVLKSFDKKFLLKKPSAKWTKVTVDKDTSYEVRWIKE